MQITQNFLLSVHTQQPVILNGVITAYYWRKHCLKNNNVILI